MNRILYGLQKYWDIESIPKHELRKEEELFTDLTLPNLFYITTVIGGITICVLLVLLWGLI